MSKCSYVCFFLLGIGPSFHILAVDSSHMFSSMDRHSSCVVGLQAHHPSNLAMVWVFSCVLPIYCDKKLILVQSLWTLHKDLLISNSYNILWLLSIIIITVNVLQYDIGLFFVGICLLQALSKVQSKAFK